MDDKRRDWELIRQFVDTRSQPAFAELTRRYLGLVHATALRELGDRTLAEDTTQAVFLILARRAHTFRPNIVLAAWLFDTCKFTAKNARRDERRRAARERKIAMQMQQESSSQPHTTDITDLTLNEALSALPKADRQAVLLRFVCGYSLQETGEVFGISENTARMRIDRAVAKMRRILTKAGIGLSAIAIAEGLQAQSAQSASAALEARITDLAFAHSAAALAGVPAYTIAQGALKSMALVNLKIAAVVTCGLVLAGGTTYRGIAHSTNSGFRGSGSRGAPPTTSVVASAVPRMDAQIRAKLKQHLDAVALYTATVDAYHAMDTYSFTETGAYEHFGNPRSMSADSPFQMKFTFKRPAQFEMRVTQAGNTSRILYQDSKVLRIPEDAPANYKIEDPRSVHVMGIDKIYWPMVYALQNTPGIHVTAVEVWFLFILPSQSKSGSREPISMGPPSVIDQVQVDTLVWSATDKRGKTYTMNTQIGHNDHLIRRITEQTQFAGKLADRYTVTYTDIEVNQPIPPATFLFTPPSSGQAP